MLSKIVLALGGNALGETIEEQHDAMGVTAKIIVNLIETGNQVVVTHGNGPQVGMIQQSMELNPKTSLLPVFLPRSSTPIIW